MEKIKYSEYLSAVEKTDKEKAAEYADMIIDLSEKRQAMQDPSMNNIMQNAFIGLVEVADEILETAGE